MDKSQLGRCRLNYEHLNALESKFKRVGCNLPLSHPQDGVANVMEMLGVRYTTYEEITPLQNLLSNS